MTVEFDLGEYLNNPQELADKVAARSEGSGKAIVRVWKNDHELTVVRHLETGPGEMCLALLDPNSIHYSETLSAVVHTLYELAQAGRTRSHDLGRVIDPEGESNLISVLVAPSTWKDIKTIWHQLHSNAV